MRCFSCGRPVAQLWEEFSKRTKAGEKPKKVMDDLGLTRFCCRALFMGHVDIMHTVAKFKKA